MRSRNGPPELDDWLAGDGGFDWPDDSERDDETIGEHRSEGVASPAVAPVRRTPASAVAGRRPDAATFVRRRRILALAALGLFVATAVAIALATAGGRSGKASFTPAVGSGTTIAPQPVTPPPPPSQPSASTKTKTTTTTVKASAATLQVTLPSDESLALEDTGQAVVKLQKALARLGYDVEADGTFGTGTEEAVKTFQAANGLTADGVAGSATVQKLNEALARG